MKRKRSESMGNGLEIFEGYDPVIESMLLEWEVERQAMRGGHRPRATGAARGESMVSNCASGGDSGGVADAIFNQGMCHFERTREISLYKDRSLTFVRDDN
jgi:hypothetical protein